jgi:hypothetical protein
VARGERHDSDDVGWSTVDAAKNASSPARRTRGLSVAMIVRRLAIPSPPARPSGFRATWMVPVVSAAVVALSHLLHRGAM